MRNTAMDSEVGGFMHHVLNWVEMAYRGQLDLGEIVRMVQEVISRTETYLDHVEPHPDSCTIDVRVPDDTGELVSPVPAWQHVDDVIAPVGELTLEVVGFMTEEEDDRLEGVEMVRRARVLGAELGQRHGEAMLSQQDQIPRAWRKFGLLVFPSTTWRSGYDVFVLGLFWRNKAWEAFWSPISGTSSKRWRPEDRLVRVREVV